MTSRNPGHCSWGSLAWVALSHVPQVPPLPRFHSHAFKLCEHKPLHNHLHHPVRDRVSPFYPLQYLASTDQGKEGRLTWMVWWILNLRSELLHGQASAFGLDSRYPAHWDTWFWACGHTPVLFFPKESKSKPHIYTTVMSALTQKSRVSSAQPRQTWKNRPSLTIFST